MNNVEELDDFISPQLDEKIGSCIYFIEKTV